MSGRTRHLLIVLLLLDSDSVHFDIVPLVGRLPFDSRLWRRILYCVGAKSEQIISWGLSKHSRQTPYIFTFWQSFNTNKSQNREAPISASKGQKVDSWKSWKHLPVLDLRGYGLWCRHNHAGLELGWKRKLVESFSLTLLLGHLFITTDD